MKKNFWKTIKEKADARHRRNNENVNMTNLRKDMVMLENGTILDRRPKEYESHVYNMINCDSPGCNAQSVI